MTSSRFLSCPDSPGGGDKDTSGRLSTALAPTPSLGLRVAAVSVSYGVRGRVQTGVATASGESRCSDPSPLHVLWGDSPQTPQPTPFQKGERGAGWGLPAPPNRAMVGALGKGPDSEGIRRTLQRPQRAPLTFKH